MTSFDKLVNELNNKNLSFMKDEMEHIIKKKAVSQQNSNYFKPLLDSINKHNAATSIGTMGFLHKLISFYTSKDYNCEPKNIGTLDTFDKLYANTDCNYLLRSFLLGDIKKSGEKIKYLNELNTLKITGKDYSTNTTIKGGSIFATRKKLKKILKNTKKKRSYRTIRNYK